MLMILVILRRPHGLGIVVQPHQHVEGGRAKQQGALSRFMGGRAASNVSPPTHFIQVDGCASSTTFIEQVEDASFGADLRMEVRRGTVEPVGIL